MYKAFIYLGALAPEDGRMRVSREEAAAIEAGNRQEERELERFVRGI